MDFTLAAVHNSEHYFAARDNIISPSRKLTQNFFWLINQQLQGFHPKQWLRAYFSYGLWHFINTRKRLLPDYSGWDSFFLDPGGRIYCSNVNDQYLGDLLNIKKIKVDKKRLNNPANWLICTVRSSIKRHPFKVMAWIIKNKLRRAINLSENKFSDQEKISRRREWLAGAIIFAAVLAIVGGPGLSWYLLLLLVPIFIYRLSFKLELGLLWLVFLTPFINWQVFVSQAVNAPPVDWLGLALIPAYGLYLWRLKPRRQIKFPAWLPLIIFVIIGAVSAGQSYFLPASLKFLLRPIIFCYFIYLVLPANLIKTERLLHKIINLWFWLGASLAVCSLIDSLVSWNGSHSLFRVTTVTFGYFSPLGANQNLLAELLVTVVPLGLLLLYRNFGKKIIFTATTFGLLLSIITLLLTFSRAGWLIFAGQLICFLIFTYKKISHEKLVTAIKERLRYYTISVLVIFLFIAPFMISILSHPAIASSNSNRLFQWNVGLEMLRSNFLFGQGPGTFIEILNRDPYYVFEFGSTLDAHGLPLKLLSETGLLGFIAFLVFILLIFFRAVKIFLLIKFDYHKYLTLGCLILAAGSMALFQLTNTSFYTAKMWLPLGLLAAATYLYENRGKKN